MTGYEKFIVDYGMIFVMLVIVLTLVEGVLFLKNNASYIARKNISYDNYRKYRRKYQIHLNIWMFLPYGIVSLLTVAVSMMVGRFEQTQLYLIPLAIALIINATLPVFNLMMVYHNKELKLPDYYYQIVEKSYRERSSLLSKISEVEKAIKELNQSASDIQNNYNALVQNPRKIEHFEKTKEALLKLRENQKALEGGFDIEISRKFDLALRKFLETGVNEFENFNTSALRVEVNVGDLKRIALDQQYLIYVEYIRRAIQTHDIKSVAALIKALEILGEANAALTVEQKNELLLYVDNLKEDITGLTNQLYKSHLLTFADILEAVDKKRKWLFSVPISGYFTGDNIVEFLLKILKEDQYDIFEKYISFALKSDFDSLQKALELITVQNKTIDYAYGCLKLLSHDSIFDDDGTKYENMSLSLKAYFLATGDKEKEKQIEEIIKNNLFVKNKKAISEAYFEAKKTIDEIYNSYSELLTIYMTNKKLKIDFISEDKTASLLTDTKKNLDFKFLKTLSNIVIGMMLVTYSKHRINIFDKVNKLNRNLLVCYRSAPIGADNAQSFGNEIIKKLISDDYISFKNVVLRIEAKRQLLDRFSKDKGVKL